MSHQTEEGYAILDERRQPAIFLHPNEEALVIRSRALSPLARLIYVQLLELRNFKREVGDIDVYLHKINNYPCVPGKKWHGDIVSALGELVVKKLVQYKLNKEDKSCEYIVPWEFPDEALEALGWKVGGQ